MSRSNSDLPQILKAADLLANSGLRQMHALGGVREAIVWATATSCAEDTAAVYLS
jgi:hypothetical protein